jgi:hypothetical protein
MRPIAKSTIHHRASRLLLTLEDNREALPDLLSLIHALDRLPPSSIVDQARGQLKQVKHALEKP